MSFRHRSFTATVSSIIRTNHHPFVHPLVYSFISDVQGSRCSRERLTACRPFVQQHKVCRVAGVAHNSSSNHLQQYSQPGSIQQQQQQQTSHHDAASAPQPPVGASFLPPSSSSFLAGNHFGGNSGSGNVSIHLPLGVSHVDPDGYLTSPGQPVGSVNPIQTGMGGLTHPSHSGLSNAHQLAFGKPVQTGMGDPNQPGGLYHRGTSGQALGPRQHMQVTSCCCRVTVCSNMW